MLRGNCKTGCLSLDSYIKPQPDAFNACKAAVVYLLIPTSNHNFNSRDRKAEKVVYLLIPTSNHN